MNKYIGKTISLVVILMCFGAFLILTYDYGYRTGYDKPSLVYPTEDCEEDARELEFCRKLYTMFANNYLVCMSGVGKEYWKP